MIAAFPQTPSLPESLYRYVWRVSRTGQLRICLLTAIVTPLAMVPLELQRRIVDDALYARTLWLLLALGAGYLAVVIVQNAIKYLLNVVKGRVLEVVARDLRYRILARAGSGGMDEGTAVSMLAAEAEEVGGFASESLSVPLLQGGTILFVAGYLTWVEPRVAVLALFLYLPQAIVVPRVQQAINRLIRRRTWTIRKLDRNVIDALRHFPLAPDELRERAGSLIEAAFDTRMKIYVRKYFLTLFGNLLDALGPIVVLVVGGYLVIRGETEISTLVVFISGLQKIADPWDQLINFYRTTSNKRTTYLMIEEALEPASNPAALATRKLSAASRPSES